MHSSNNTYFDSREELLLELQEERAQLRRYADEEDAVTRLLQASLEDDPEWIVVVAAHDRRMLSADQLSAALRSGEVTPETLVWRSGMRVWSPIAAIPQLTVSSELARGEAAPLVHAAPHRQPSPPPLPRAPAKKAFAEVELPMPEVDSETVPSTRVKQAVMGLSALIMLGVFLTMFAISSSREDTGRDARPRGTQPSPSGAQPMPEEDLPTTAAALLSETESN